MKKLLALLLALAMAVCLFACAAKPETPAAQTGTEEAKQETGTEEKKEDPKQQPAPEPEKEVEKVTYFCTVGAYLGTLTRLIDEWNAGEGAENGVYIEVTSNINDGSKANEILMQAGTFHDISDGGYTQSWVLNGWTKDLYEIDDPELKEMIAVNEPYFFPNVCVVNGILTSLPLEILPIKLAVNTDLLEQYGYDMPETIDDMVDIALGIYEKSGGESYGFGGSTWSATIRRLLFKSTLNSTGRYYWDPNTGTYDFSPFRKIIEAYAEMYQAGAVLGLDDLGIDEIRAQFAAGKVAFFPAPSYDYGVYTEQFPAQCSWTVIDMPTYEPGPARYTGVYIGRSFCSIIAPAYDNATEAHQKAVVKAFCFLNSDYVKLEVYKMGGIIPVRPDLIEAVDVNSVGPQFAAFADCADYVCAPIFPDNVIQLEGDKFKDVFLEVIYGNLTFDEAVEDLNERYNAAVEAAKQDPEINMDMYIYPWSNAK